MRPQTIDDDQLVDALWGVFSRHGFEGASLKLLSEATGLKRASLYHRFPGGKDEIVEAVVARASSRFAQVLAPAFGKGDPASRARAVANGIDNYYCGGEESCIIIAMSLSDAARRDAVAPCVAAWIDAFTAIAKDTGCSPTRAKHRAEDAVALLEGTLIIAATSGDAKPFRRAIASLPDRLLKG